MTSYTSGDWTVSSLYTDTISASKNVAVPDLSYGTDFARTLDEPTEARIANTTASEISAVETIRYGRSDVENIYAGTKVDASSQFPYKRGTQVLVEINETYRATNSKTGAVVDLPVKGRLVLRFPTAPIVAEAMITDAMHRTIAAALDKSGTDAARLIECARGALLPAGI